MGIIGIERAKTGHSSCSINYKFEREYSRTYWVYTDSVLYDEYYVRTNLPADPIDGQRLTLFSGYVHDGPARLKNISCDRGEVAAWNGVSKGDKWIVRCDWGQISPTEASESGNPFDVRPDVTIDGVPLQKPFDLDTEGKPVLNSAYDYFNPPPMTDDQRHVIRITHNKPKAPLDTIVNAANKTNQGMWFQFPDQTVKVDPLSFAILYSQFLDDEYFRVSNTLVYRPDGWKRKIIDAGFRGLDPTTGKLIDLFDSRGMPLQDEVMLDGHGRQLAYPVDKDSIITLEFKEYDTIDFNSTFNFPEDLFG